MSARGVNTPEHERGVEAAARAVGEMARSTMLTNADIAKLSVEAYLRERPDLVEPEALREAAIRRMPRPFVAALDHLLEREFGADHAV